MSTKIRMRGFTLLELLVVVGVIAIIAAVSVPYIMNWLQLYRLRAASQEVVSEFQAARTQAVMKNANNGVALFIVDANSYRFVNYDLLNSADPVLRGQALSRLKTLPNDIVFDATTLGGTATEAVRFSRLGGACFKAGATACDPVPPACAEAECGDNSTTTVWMVSAPTAPVPVDPNTMVSVGLRDLRNNLTRSVDVAFSGRISEKAS